MKKVLFGKQNLKPFQHREDRIRRRAKPEAFNLMVTKKLFHMKAESRM